MNHPPPAPFMPQQIVLRPTTALVPYARNARTHSPQQVRLIAESIQQFGFTNPVLVAADGTIIAGHGRVLAAQLLGLAQVPTISLHHLSDAQRRAYVLADNQLATQSAWDESLLAAELRALAADQFPLPVLGFSDDELRRLVDGPVAGAATDAAASDPDDVPAEQPVVHSKPGELYQLGPHRLLCGDSTSPDAWQQVMGGRLADAVMTDPPYGKDYVGGCSDPRSENYKAGDKVDNDGADQVAVILPAALACAMQNCRGGGAWYVAAPAGPAHVIFSEWLNRHGIMRQVLVWFKDQMVFGRSDYHYQHEFIYYGWKPGSPHREPPDRKQVSVWQVPRPKRSAEHPTMKPVELYERMMRNSTIPGELVAEPFGGSGTTLIAAANTGRICHCIEIAPRYCDVIRRRYTAWARQRNQDPGPGALEP